MTDNEIIKAWDILAKIDFFGGQRAGRELWSEKPVDVQNEDLKNFSEAVAFIKDFINSQKSEFEKKDIEIAILIRKKEALNDEISELKAEIERLLKHNTEMARKHYQDGKAEAIKEFAERLKEKFVKEFRLNLLEKKFIDDLVKEMTE